MYTIFTNYELDYLIGPMKLYGSDKQIIINCGNTNDDFITKLDKYCEANNYEWDFSDSVVEDFNMGIAYTADVFGNYPDVIMGDCEWLGRAGFDDGTYDWSTISDGFINQSSRALPEWFPTEQLESDGFELQSCAFSIDWYDSMNDDPAVILAKANDAGYNVVFQLNYTSPFAVGFCVYKQEQS